VSPMQRSKAFTIILLRKAAALAATLLFCFALFAETPVSLPKGTIEGTMSSGLRYLILHNDSPRGRVEFRLVVGVGSLLEEPSERGAAHYIEHLAFGDTKHFSDGKAVEYIESHGVKFGIGINAYTGCDRTVYMFTMPSGAESVIDTSLLIIRDWMDGVKINSSNVEGERGIISEEIRAYDVGDDFYSLKIGNGKHSKGIPIGSLEEVKSLKPSTLRKFYKRSYSPSLATIMVVGDVSPREVEDRILSIFSSLKARPVPMLRLEGELLPLSEVPLSYPSGLCLSETRDSLREDTSLELIFPHPTTVQRTLEDAVRKQQERLLVRALSERFRVQGMRVDVSNSWYLADTDHFTLSLRASSREELLRKVSDIAGELSSVIRYGFEEEELGEEKRELCQRLLNTSPEENRSSFEICEYLTDYALSGDRYIFSNEENRLVAEALSGTESSLLQEILKDYIENSRKGFLAACRSHEGLGERLSEDELLSAWESGLERKTPPELRYSPKRAPQEAEPTPTETPKCLLERPLFAQEQISSTTEYGNIGVLDVCLANGIRLILKPTTSEEGRLYLSSLSPFGVLSKRDSSLLEYLSYMDGGIEGVGEEALSDYMYESGIALNMMVDKGRCGFLAMAPSDKSLELFNLLYQRSFFPLKPKFLPAEEEEEKGETMLSKMLKRDISRQMSSRISFLMGDIPSSPKAEGEVSAKELTEFYKSLYCKTEGLTYIVCGDFDKDSVLRDFVSVFAQAEKRGGVVPKPRTAEFPQGRKVELFRSNSPSRTDFNYLFFGHYTPSLKASLTLKLMRDLVWERLISELRERDGLVYSPYISLFYDGSLEKFYFDIEASADSRNMALIYKNLQEIIETLCNEEASKEELEVLKKSFLVSKEDTLSGGSASAWREVLSGLLKNREEVSDFNIYEEVLSSITPTEVRKAFNEWVIKDSSVLLLSQAEDINIIEYE